MNDLTNNSAQQQVIYKALEYINELGQGELTYGWLQDKDENSFYLYVIDEKMREHVHKSINKDLGNTMSTVKIVLGKSYFWSRVADPYDSAIGITRDMDLYQKALLRCAYKILEDWHKWYNQMTTQWPSLKYKK